MAARSEQKARKRATRHSPKTHKVPHAELNILWEATESVQLFKPRMFESCRKWKVSSAIKLVNNLGTRTRAFSHVEVFVP